MIYGWEEGNERATHKQIRCFLCIEEIAKEQVYLILKYNSKTPTSFQLKNTAHFIIRFNCLFIWFLLILHHTSSIVIRVSSSLSILAIWPAGFCIFLLLFSLFFVNGSDYKNFVHQLPYLDEICQCKPQSHCRAFGERIWS